MDTIAPQGPSANTDRLDGFVHKFVKNAWYVAAQAREVEHAPLGRRILNTPILLYRTSAGKVVALHDICPHRFMPMSKGRLVGDSIRCTYHGSLFDETGKCTEIPSQENIPPKCFLQSYPVAERKNWVWIWMGDPAKADAALIPGESFLGFGHEDYSTVDHKYRVVKGRYGLCNENLIDDTHISFLHLGQFESGGRVHTMPEVSQEGPWVKSRWFDAHEKISPFFHMLFDVDYEFAPRALVGHFHPPATHVVWIEMYNPKAPEEKPRVLRVALAFTPETESTTHWFWAESRNFHQKDAAWDAFATDTSWAIQDQDFYAIEAIEALLQQGTELPEEVSFKADAGIMRARRVMNQIIREEFWEMSALLDGIAQRISASAGEDAGISGVFKFDAGQDGVLVIDTTAKPIKVSTTDRPADCTMKMAAPFLMMAVDGRMPVGAAFMKFVRGVRGPPALAVQIQPFLRKVAENGKS